MVVVSIVVSVNVTAVIVDFEMSCELIKSMIDCIDVMRHNYKFQLLKEFVFLISTKNRRHSYFSFSLL